MGIPPIEAQFFQPDNWWQAWAKVRRKRGCAGVDGETIERFERHAERYLKELRRSVLKGTYRPLPLQAIWIPKSSGGWRQLGVPTVRDRIVQQALLQVLHPVLDPQFEVCSFAYRPGRSHRMAVDQVGVWHRQGYSWVLDADIVKYFNNVQHQRLLAEVQERFAYPDLLDLIEDWIATGVMTKAGLILPQKGIPQGAVVSPILANVYLDDFDETLLETRLKLVRYADDFVVLGRTEDQVQLAQEQVAVLLAEIGLELHPEKTQITNFKRGFKFLGHTFVGDLVVPVKSSRQRAKEGRKSAASFVGQVTHADPLLAPSLMQQALVEALQAAERPVPPPLMVVLGYKVREAKPVKIESTEVSWQGGMSTLYLVQQETRLRKDHGRFVVKTQAEGKTETISVPIRDVERILVFGNVQLSTPVIATCLQQHIPVIFLTQLGEYKGHLWSAELQDLETEAAQFGRRDDAVFQLETARAIVRAKLLNSRQLLLRLNRKRKRERVEEAIAGLLRDIEAVGAVDNLDTLRGYEGTGAARYFRALGQLIINEGFEFGGRNRRPPQDPVNSLLSFGYTLVYNNVLAMILAEGLNPHLGNLHRSERKEMFLAFDLVEEFRSMLVDTLVLKLVNKRILRPTDFTWPTESGGVYLTEAARRIFLKKMEERLGNLTSHPDVQGRVSYRRAIQLQVRRYKRSVIAGVPYEPMLRVV